MKDKKFLNADKKTTILIFLKDSCDHLNNIFKTWVIST